jgi:zinc protease
MNHRRGLILGVLCAVILSAPPVPAPAAEALATETFTLSNGMEVIVIPNHRVPAVSHMLWFRIGAADDPPGKSGLAHYHEHMMFQGTSKLKPGEYADVIARHGGQQNAFTGSDVTSYYVNIAKSELPMAMELEADRIRGLKPSDEGAEKEKQVIIEERRSRVENNPEALLSEQMNAALFRHHPYRVPVIGWMHEMEKLSKDDVLKFHRTWYHPNNALLIVSGDITAAELRPLAEKYYGNLPRKAVPERRWTAEPPQNAPRQVTLYHTNVKQPLWGRSYMAPSLAYGDKSQAMPLFVLSQLLGGGKTSHLYRTLVVEQKLASSVDVDYSGFSLGPAQFSITIVPETGVAMQTLEKAVDKEIAGVQNALLAAKDLQRAKTLLRAESTFARDGLTSMARIMGWIRMAGLDKDYFQRWPELIDAVTLDQVNASAKTTLKIEQSVTGWLLPQTEMKEAKP